MNKKTTVILIPIVLISALVWLMKPVYQFYAHSGKAPMPPFGYMEIPVESPVKQELGDSNYKAVGDEALESLTKHKLTINAPAISAAVAIDGRLVWAGASGWADIEAKTPVTTQTQFRIGSTSKALTATGLARLVDAENFDIDTPISQTMKVLPNSQWRDITPRQLASHMSGLPHYEENTDYVGLIRSASLSTRYDNVLNAVGVFDGGDLLWEPGSHFHYSSLATVLLSAVMQESADKPYLEIMQSEVFKPLGMSSTMAEAQARASATLATFYWNNKGRLKQVKKWRDVDLSHRLAGGGFVSTSSDLVKMGVAFLDESYISPSTREMFWTPQVLSNGNINPQNYALGWRVREVELEGVGLIKHTNHGGVSKGAQSWLMVIPEYRMAVAVNINSNTDVFWDFGRVSMELAQKFIVARNAIH